VPPLFHYPKYDKASAERTPSCRRGLSALSPRRLHVIESRKATVSGVHTGEGGVPIERFRVGDALRFGWDVMAANLGYFVLVILIFSVASLVPSLLQRAFYDVDPLVVVFGIAGLVISTFIGMAYVRIGLKFCDGIPPEYSDVYASYPAFWRFLAGTLLYGLLVIAGLILLIVPGIYWAIKYYFVPYLILDRDMGPMESFARSGSMTYGEKWDLLVFWLAILGMNILGAILCLIGLFVTMPMSLVAVAYVYRRLLVTEGTQGQVAPQAPVPSEGHPPQAPTGAPPQGLTGGRVGPKPATTPDEQPPVPPPPSKQEQRPGD
jgi:uncharacterized membrane protein